MKKKALAREMKKLNAESSKQTESYNREINDTSGYNSVSPDLRGQDHEDQQAKENSEQRPQQGTLPNVKVLMKSYAHLDEKSQEEYRETGNHAKSTSNFTAGNQQEKNFVRVEVEVEAHPGVSGKWQQDLPQSTQTSNTAYLYHVQSHDAKFGERFQSSVAHVHHSDIKDANGGDYVENGAHDAVSFVSENLPRIVSQTKPEPVSFAEHPHNMASAGHQLQPLIPVIITGSGLVKSEENISETSPVGDGDRGGGGGGGGGYHYHNDHISAWEQENNRYATYACKNPDNYPVYVGGSIALSNSSNNNNDHTFPDNNESNDMNDAIVFNNNHHSIKSVKYISGSESDQLNQTYYSDDPCGKISVSNGRRRRKRVQTPMQRTAANMRERRRMCHLNVAFDRLKDHLPNVKDKRKLSRIQTLKAAIYYIHLLRDSLNLC